MTSYTHTIREGEALAKPVASAFVFCAAVVWGCASANATIDNTANATGTVGALQVLSNDVTVQVPVNSLSSMQVTKTADDTTDVTAGQVVTYTYVVRNTGNTALNNIALSDSHNASGPVPVPGGEFLSDDQGTSGDSSDVTPSDGIWSSLAPGDAITLTATYTVQQSDVDDLQ